MEAGRSGLECPDQWQMAVFHPTKTTADGSWRLAGEIILTVRKNWQASLCSLMIVGGTGRRELTKTKTKQKTKKHMLPSILTELKSRLTKK